MVLFAVVAMFTGLETAVSAAPVAKTAKSCCDDCGHDQGQDGPASPSAPPSAPGCPAFLCLSVDVVVPVTPPLPLSLEIIPFFSFIPEPIPDPFIKSIFHPPSLA